MTSDSRPFSGTCWKIPRRSLICSQHSIDSERSSGREPSTLEAHSAVSMETWRICFHPRYISRILGSSVSADHQAYPQESHSQSHSVQWGLFPIASQRRVRSSDLLKWCRYDHRLPSPDTDSNLLEHSSKMMTQFGSTSRMFCAELGCLVMLTSGSFRWRTSETGPCGTRRVRSSLSSFLLRMSFAM